MRIKLLVLCCSLIMPITISAQHDYKSGLLLPRVKDAQGFLSPSFLQALVSLTKASVFIETGTYLGETAARAATFFAEVYTVELDKNLFERASKLCGDLKHLHIFHGYSPQWLTHIIKSVAGKKMLFWLDAHYSGPGTARAESNTPILKELAAIKESGVTDAVILIDDMRLFTESDVVSTDVTHQGYPSIDMLINAIHEINAAYAIYLFDDIAMAMPPAPEASEGV